MSKFYFTFEADEKLFVDLPDLCELMNAKLIKAEAVSSGSKLTANVKRAKKRVHNKTVRLNSESVIRLNRLSVPNSFKGKRKVAAAEAVIHIFGKDKTNHLTHAELKGGLMEALNITDGNASGLISQMCFRDDKKVLKVIR